MVLNISDKQIDKVLDDLKSILKEKIKKKGSLSFNSPLEGFGKITEEYHELLWEVHEKDWKKFESEAFDVIIASLWTVMGMRTNEEFNKN